MTDYTDRFLEIKAEIAELEQELEALKPYIYDTVSEAGGVLNKGSLTIKTDLKVTYEYSQETASMEKILKAKKRIEEADGTARIVKQTGFVKVYKN